MTMVELLLVVALLVVVSSLAAPTVTGSFASVRLRRSGDIVIAAWTRARAQAIETGVPYQFRFTPETGDYRIAPWLGVELSGTSLGAPSAATGVASTPTAESTASSTSTTAAPNSTATGESAEPVEATLPETIVFHEGQVATIDPLRAERVVDQLKGPDVTESSPILFFPDGTASTASIVLTNGREQYLRLTIRGLTGVTRASAVLTREEMDQGSRTP
jgi:Tfp pilus assembly protein FimT